MPVPAMGEAVPAATEGDGAAVQFSALLAFLFAPPAGNAAATAPEQPAPEAEPRQDDSQNAPLASAPNFFFAVPAPVTVTPELPSSESAGEPRATAGAVVVPRMAFVAVEGTPPGAERALVEVEGTPVGVEGTSAAAEAAVAGAETPLPAAAESIVAATEATPAPGPVQRPQAEPVSPAEVPTVDAPPEVAFDSAQPAAAPAPEPAFTQRLTGRADRPEPGPRLETEPAPRPSDVPGRDAQPGVAVASAQPAAAPAPEPAFAQRPTERADGPEPAPRLPTEPAPRASDVPAVHAQAAIAAHSARVAAAPAPELAFAARLTERAERQEPAAEPAATKGAAVRLPQPAAVETPPTSAGPAVEHPAEHASTGERRQPVSFRDSLGPDTDARSPEPAAMPDKAPRAAWISPPPEPRPVRAEAPAQPAASAAAELEPPRTDTPSGPVRQLSLSVSNRAPAGETAERIEVRLVERAGQVHVAVRSADPHLTQSLRAQLGDLVTRLEHTGYRTETWLPATPLAAASDGPASTAMGSGQGGTADPDHEGSSQSGRENPGWTGGDSHQRRRGDDQPRPQWLAALEGSFGPEKHSTRSIPHGFGN